MTTTNHRISLDVRRLAGALGAEVRGIDLSVPIDDEQRAAIETLLLEHLVLFFPAQHLTPTQHRAFASGWGEMEIHPYLRKVEGFPEIVELSSAIGMVADDWHTDVTFSARPPIMSILNHVETPAVGGDTMWTNQYAVYDSLSAPMRELLDGLTCIHTARTYNDPATRAEHPAVRVHPRTGRKCLYVNGQFTERFVELSFEESNNLLDFLRRYATHPRFTVRYAWTKGTVAMWDNRCTQHKVVADNVDALRKMELITLQGDKPS